MTEQDVQRMLSLGLLEDSLALVKGPDGRIHIIIPTCTSIKYSDTQNLKSKLDELESRIAALENGNLKWNGISNSEESSS